MSDSRNKLEYLNSDFQNKSEPKNSNKLLLSLVDKVNEVFYQFDNSSKILPAPRLAIVGTQSSGKSTLVNRMIGLEIIPTGTGMMTQTPINVRMHTIDNTNSVVLTVSFLENGALIEFFKTTLQADNKSVKLDQFRKKIIECTEKITNKKYSVSNTPIFIDVYSSKVINFSFVDLPGQIAIACVDKGQPEGLAEEIEELITNQITIPNTIVLTVVQSKTDLETDIGLALVKKLQKHHKSFYTIGVVTKPDLLDISGLDKLNDIVGGNISKNIMMDEGYFVVNNKSETLQAEANYFMQNFDNKKEIITQKKFGITHLLSYLQKYLITMIKKSLPDIKLNLTEILKAQKARGQVLGIELKDASSKISYIGKVIYQLNKSIVNSLESNGTIPNVGSKIGKIIEIFVSDIVKLNPYSESNLSDEYISGIIESFNGYHLTTQISLEQLIERCIVDKKIQSVMSILPISITCVNSIVHILEDTVDQIIKSGVVDNLESYPKLKSLISTQINQNIKLYSQTVIDDIDKYLKTEEDFFWSTSDEFKLALNDMYMPKNVTHNEQKISYSDITNTFKQLIQDKDKDKEKSNKISTTIYNYNVDQVRLLSNEYFKTISTRARDYIVKLIVSGIIKKLEKNITNDLNQIITLRDGPSIHDLFVEDPETSKERLIVCNNIVKIEEIITGINTCE